MKGSNPVTMVNNKYQKKIWTIPNILSLFRISLIPVIIWMYVVKQNNVMTFFVLSFSGMTDIVDGFIARRFNMISEIGRVLDPVADKLTQTAMLVCLVIRYDYMLIPLLLLVFKEFCTAITGYVSYKCTSTVQGAHWHGKLSTIMLYLMMASHLIWFDIPKPVSVGLVGLCVVVMTISFILYSIRNIRAIFNKSF